MTFNSGDEGLQEMVAIATAVYIRQFPRGPRGSLVLGDGFQGKLGQEPGGTTKHGPPPSTIRTDYPVENTIDKSSRLQNSCHEGFESVDTATQYSCKIECPIPFEQSTSRG